MLQLYRVTIHNFDDCVENRFEFGSFERGSLPLAGTSRRLVVRAANSREAAAQAWILLEGKKRRAFLIKIGAPAFILRAQTNVQKVAGELTSLTDEFGPCWKLDNDAEAWLIVVGADECVSQWTSRFRDDRRHTSGNSRRSSHDLSAIFFENNLN